MRLRIDQILAALGMLGAVATASAAGSAVLSPRSAVAVSQAQAQSRGADDQVVWTYVTVDPARVSADDLRGMGIDVSLDLGTTLTARLTLGQISQLAEVDGVEYIQVSAPVEQMLDVAKGEVNATLVHQGTGIDKPYKGAGVVVGVVDNGFDYRHPAFYGPDGQLRIRRVWEQNSTPTADMPSPAGYGYGIELTTAADIERSEGDLRGKSHGTHVASIAAGSDSYLDGALQGMAPEADIVLVSMLDDGGSNVTISDAIAYIFGYADSVDKPCVINLSLGAHHGPHDGTSTFDAIADALQGPGRLIVGSAGNHRAGNFHVRRAFAGADDAVLRTFIDYKTSLSEKNAGGEIDLWAEPGADIEVALAVYRVASAEMAERVVVYPPADDARMTAVTLGRNVTGRFDVATETSPLNGKVHVLLTSMVTALRSGYAIAIEVTPRSAAVVDLWGDNIRTGLTSRDMAGFTGPAGESTICEIGGTARRILTVGAYTTRSEFLRLGETEPSRVSETDGTLSSFSSCGPTADGRMKPQVTAPGSMISAAVSNFDNSGTLLYSQYYNDGRRDNFYGYMQGTSMSSPMVAGMVATWLQAWPQMTPEDLVEVIRTTARTDVFTGPLAGGDNDWGYGKADALAGLKECISRSGTGGVNTVLAERETPVRLLRADGGSATLLVTTGCKAGSADVYAIDGTKVSSTGIGELAPSQTIDVQLPGAGAYVISVDADGAHTAVKVIVK